MMSCMSFALVKTIFATEWRCCCTIYYLYVSCCSNVRYYECEGFACLLRIIFAQKLNYNLHLEALQRILKFLLLDYFQLVAREQYYQLASSRVATSRLRPGTRQQSTPEQLFTRVGTRPGMALTQKHRTFKKHVRITEAIHTNQKEQRRVFSRTNKQIIRPQLLQPIALLLYCSTALLLYQQQT